MPVLCWINYSAKLVRRRTVDADGDLSTGDGLPSSCSPSVRYASKPI